ncbi:peptidylprolyl isomerase [Wenyingzhuangia sp. IMCC45574]
MAILSKIRDRSGFLIAAIGLAMLSFVISPKDIYDFLSSKNSDAIGKVNGEEISYKEFARRVELYKSNSRSNYGGLTIENMVWNQMVREKIYEIKLKEAGVVVGEEELWQAIISSQQITSSPQFKGANGQFSEEALKNYIADLQADKSKEGQARIQGWLSFEKDIKYNLLTQTYNDLINYGVGVSKAEATSDYVLKNTKVSGDFVYLPYASIENTAVKVTEDEVAGYVKNHAAEYETEATRNLKFVKFPFEASEADEKAIEAELTKMIEDETAVAELRLESGLKNATDIAAFAEEVETDLPLVDRYQSADEIPAVIKEAIVNGTEGAVVGPYKFSKYYKLTKLVGTKKLPDSVQASHILINFAGAQGAQPTVRRSLADAQKLADSLLTVVTKSPKQFGTLAQNYSADQGSAAKKGDLGWFGYRAMVPEFRDYCFENAKGDMGVVRTNYGFHVINIQDQKDFNLAYKLATISKKIEASEETENIVFRNAETFAKEVRDGGDLEKLAKEKNYTVSPINGIKELDVYVGSLGDNRKIVRWAFEKETGINSSKRFDLDENGYAVVVVDDLQEKGLKSAKNAFSQVEPILVKEKKAALLKAKMEGTSLDAIASANKLTVTSFSNATLGAPTIAGIGVEPKVIGAAISSKENTLVTNVVGDKGVFAFVTKEVVKATADDKAINVKNSSKAVQGGVARQLLDALKEGVEIEDYRAERF